MTSDLRIYYGNARITLDPDDPRVAQILALVITEAQAIAATLKAPQTDAEFLAMARAYFTGSKR